MMVENKHKTVLDSKTIAVLKSNNPLFILEYAVKQPEELAYVLALGIIGTHDAESIYKFALRVPGAPIYKLAYEVSLLQDAQAIYHFARFVPNAPINLLSKALIATKNPEYLYRFASEVVDAPLSQLVLAIMTTGDALWIAKCIQELPLSYDLLKQLLIALRATSNLNYIWKIVLWITQNYILVSDDQSIKTDLTALLTNLIPQYIAQMITENNNSVSHLTSSLSEEYAQALLAAWSEIEAKPQPGYARNRINPL